jgi:hypothetical protein
MKSTYITLLGLAMALGCKNSATPTIGPSAPGENVTQVEINLDKRFQVMESFAASDCWDPNYVGKHWAESEKEGLARLLFSKGIKDGKPEGIGLSGWRVNLGGGTAQQGAASDIGDHSRRAEAFIDIKTGKIDWSQQAGQQYFLQKAKEYGVEQYVLFSNTPPVLWTKNGKGYSHSGVYSNLKEDAYDDFAEYMAETLAHFQKEKGIQFDFISPVNEPQHNWADPSQEGSAWQNAEVAKLTRELNASLLKRDLKTKILLAEAADWKSVYETDGDAGRKNVVANLFSPASPNYVGNLSNVSPIIAGHSYWTDGSWSQLTQVRSQVKASAEAAGLKVYQTEWSMLGDGYDLSEFIGYDKASYMDIALYMSKVIHTDLVYAQAVSWSYWTSMATERWGHKNRFFLIRLKPNGADMTQGGTHEASKTLWVLGNYSRFVRPGYQRVEIKVPGESKEKFGTAYVAPDGKTVVAVYSNLSSTSLNVKANLSGVKSIKTYVTNATQDLVENSIADISANILVHPGSVMTVVYSL